MTYFSSVVLWTCAVLSLSAFVLALTQLLLNHGRYTVLHVRESELCLIPDELLRERRFTRLRIWTDVVAAGALVVALLATATWVSIALTGAKP
jgi:hypothetical protein